MPNKHQMSGKKTRTDGFKFEDEIYNILNKSKSLLIKIIKIKYNNFNSSDINNINIYKVDLLNQSIIDKMNENYKNYLKKTKFKFEIPNDKKRACDIIILFTNNNILYNIGIDTKKSNFNMTQLARKSFYKFLNLIELDENEKKYLLNYLEYKNKKRIWNKNDNQFKINICSILNKSKEKWIKERFDNNSLYYNDLILQKDNNIIKVLKINQILGLINLNNCILKKSNFNFCINETNILGIKPHGSKKWSDIQITIYKSAFNEKTLLNEIKLE